jgi:hypothetical protein
MLIGTCVITFEPLNLEPLILGLKSKSIPDLPPTDDRFCHWERPARHVMLEEPGGSEAIYYGKIFVTL